jgi:signal transduction histidine kinase
MWSGTWQGTVSKLLCCPIFIKLGGSLIKNLTALYMSNGTSGNGLAQLDEISSEVSQAIGEVREISYNLRPYQLDRLGLTKALEAMLKKASSASGITFSVFLDDINDILSDLSAISCYRIVQEAISNILKHSCATEADVVIRRHNQKVLLKIRDNGKGFLHPGETGRSSCRRIRIARDL